MPPPLELGQGKEDAESQEAESGSSESRKNSAGRRQEVLIAWVQRAVSLEGVNSKTWSNR